MTDIRRGRLKIYMGYAAGVGKTFQMLEDAHSLRAAGVDVVVGYFESHGRVETIAKSKGLELVPRQTVEYRGAAFEEMDTDAILARRPAVCVVDEFPHTNVPGVQRSKRWEDVEKLLDSGIDVLTTMNIQHLESLNDQVEQISGIKVRETIPDWVVQRADEVVMVDLTPRALLHRLQRGVVYRPEKAESALRNFFREPTLVALRELALRQAAHEVKYRMIQNGAAAAVPVNAGAGKRHKILILVTPDPRTAMLIRRARRMSDFTGAECFAVVIQPGGDLSGLPEEESAAISRHLNFARNLHIETRILQGEDVAATLVEFGRRNGITQIFITRPHRRGVLPALSRDPAQRIVNLAKEMQIVIVSERDARPAC
jgi:two-component system, OmpR family, sensor histidine kinase KdpD